MLNSRFSDLTLPFFFPIRYENLVLIAGGIGLSPFLAILSDILHRIRKGKPCLPRNVSIIWAVKNSTELPLLSTVDMESICPFYLDKLNLETHVYVTRESEPPLVYVYSNQYRFITPSLNDSLYLFLDAILCRFYIWLLSVGRG